MLVPKLILLGTMKLKRLGITDQKSQRYGFCKTKFCLKDLRGNPSEKFFITFSPGPPYLRNAGVISSLENNHNLPKGESSHLKPRANFASPPPPSHLHHLITISQGHHRHN